PNDRRQLLRGRRAARRRSRDRTDVGASTQPDAAVAQRADAGAGRPEGGARVLRVAGAVPAPRRASRRPRLPDGAADRADRSDRARDSAPSHLVERTGHRLHGEARGRPPAARGLSRRLRHAALRLDHPLPLPERLRARGADGARRAVRRLDPVAADLEPLRRRAPDPDRRLVVELPAARPQPEHRRADGTAHARSRGGERRPRRQRRVAGHSGVIDWVPIPAGPFPMGDDDFPPDEDELPRRVVAVDEFLIARVPVTGDDERPLTYVSLHEAQAFCDRAGVRLPTELEWEAAARGGDDRLWPWGDELPDATRATFAQPIGGPSPVGLYPAGAAPCGALDLAGNVHEWTSGSTVRGGSYLSGPNELRCSARLPMHPAA